jgi:large subunit ribosomal protein L21
MYAIVEVGGKQYRVREGERIHVERLSLSEGQPYETDHVLLVGGDGSVDVGVPWVQGARVRATVIGHGRDRKVTVFKFRRSGHYQRKRGHRQVYTELSIDGIVVKGRKAEGEAEAKPKAKRAPAKKVAAQRPAAKTAAKTAAKKPPPKAPTKK